MSQTFFHGCRVLVEGAWRSGVGVLVEAGRVVAVLPVGEAPSGVGVALPGDALLAPGFVDVQVNGGGGVLFNDDPSVAGARHIAAAHRRLGTTGVLPTLISSGLKTMRAAAGVACVGGGVLGVHFEGPFLSPLRPGVHRLDFIREPGEADVALLEELAGRCPVLVTLAPECVGVAAMHRLASAGVVIAAGHSAAAFEAMVPPVRGVTHLFNAMPAPAAREPGVVAAAMLGDFFAGVILDGVHVHPAMLRLLFAVKPAERIMLVSDSMSVAGTDAAEFVLQGRRILRRHGRLTTEDGTLAGADLSLAQAVRNAVSILGVPVESAIAMASAAPADFMRLSHEVGRIAPGLRADFVLLSPGLEVLGTVFEGVLEALPGALAG
jgi:N-acetylglucosamine-6-phosphate deacetylase